jgi:hypothetical protein
LRVLGACQVAPGKKSFAPKNVGSHRMGQEPADGAGRAILEHPKRRKLNTMPKPCCRPALGETREIHGGPARTPARRVT